MSGPALAEDFMGIERKTPELEQRRSKRFRVEVAVKVHLTDAGKPSTSNGTGSNISDGGMQLFIPRNFALGEVISLELSLPYHRKALKLSAVIKNRESFNYGVEFLNPSERDKEAIVQNCRVLDLMQ
jgi:c-di-GMP-binding flagellar brake protein YcgR